MDKHNLRLKRLRCFLLVSVAMATAAMAIDTVEAGAVGERAGAAGIVKATGTVEPETKIEVSARVVGVITRLAPDPRARTDPAIESLLATPSTIGTAVPYWKFMDNSGWLVSTRECEIIALRLEDCLRTSPEVLRPEGWPDSKPLDNFHALLRKWVAFNRLASSNGGYQVR